MNEIIFILVIVLLLPYVVVPILIRRNQFFALRPNIRPAVEGFLPAFVERYFKQTEEELKSLGFTKRIDAISLDYGPNLRVFMRLFVAKQKSIVATATSLLPDSEKTPLRNFVEFSSRFADDKEVSTHNSDLASAPIEPRQKMVSALPPTTDIKTLFAFHEQILKRSKLLEIATVLPEEGKEIDLLVDSFKKDLSHQCSLGCLTFDEASNRFRPTWAGAFLMGWYSMWPLSLLRRWFYKIKARIHMRAHQKASTQPS